MPAQQALALGYDGYAVPGNKCGLGLGFGIRLSYFFNICKLNTMTKIAQNARVEDAPALVDLYYGIEAGDSDAPEPFGDTPAGRQFTKEAYEGFVRSEAGRQQSKVFVTRDDQGTPVSSLLIWFIKAGEGGLRPWNQRWPEAKPTMDAEGIDKFFEEMAAQHREIMHEDEHIYVELIITHPDHRKQGHGSTLLRKVNELADEMDQRLYLDAAAGARSLYEKLGYQANTEVTQTSELIPMVRPRKSDRQ